VSKILSKPRSLGSFIILLQISKFLRWKGTTDLNDALTQAIEEGSASKIKNIRGKAHTSNYLSKGFARRCSHCNKPEHTIERCFQLKGPKGTTFEKNLGGNLFYCTVCKTGSHSTESCFCKLSLSSEIICDYCHKWGHKILQCYSKQRDQKKKNWGSRFPNDSRTAQKGKGKHSSGTSLSFSALSGPPHENVDVSEERVHFVDPRKKVSHFSSSRSKLSKMSFHFCKKAHFVGSVSYASSTVPGVHNCKVYSVLNLSLCRKLLH